MESSRLKFSPMGATRMACPDLQTETEFFQMLDGVDGYSIKDNKLSFLSKNKVVAVFKRPKKLSKGFPAGRKNDRRTPVSD